FTYGDTNWKDKLTAFNGQTITYDEIGNPTNDGTWNYTWIGGRQMRAMYKGEFGEQGYDEITFEYNENGLRTKKTRMYYDDATGDIGYKATNYTLHGKNIVHMSDGSNNLHFFYDAQNKPAVVIFNGTAYAYLYNLQGDVIGLVDSNGTKMVSYTYDAWGKPISKTGTLASTLGTIQPFRYRGYVYDEETGLYYLNNRYYCARMCRFVNTDKYVATDYSPLCGNPFIYCRNNPSMFSDPSGELFLSALIFIGVSALVGAGTGAYIAACDGGDTGDIIEGAIEGMLTGAAAAAIGYFAPAVMIGGLKISSTIVAAGGGFLAGGLIDVGVQVGAHYIEQGTVNDFELDVDRMFETATTTAIGAAVPTLEGTKESTVTAIGSTIVAAEASVLVSTGVIIRHQLKKYKMIMMEE
ncbi:MAG: RHS repeat-associated core domain-containing protein, partial [Clostridia bacterium]|nr:RHS repeat-associated core domain-containing protein [Clostridia bacterium]